MTDDTSNSTLSAANARVLLICKNTANARAYIKSLESVGLKVDTVEMLEEVHLFLQQHKCDVLVHALEGFERTETALFHYRFCILPVAVKIHRYMIYRGANMKAVSFSLDLGMQKAIPKDEASNKLGAEVRLRLEAGLRRDSLLEQALSIAIQGRRVLNARETEVIEKSAKAFPNDPVVGVAYARILAGRGQFASAIELSRRILEAEPYNVRAMTLLGEIHSKVGQYETALKLLTKANEFAPENPERLAALADVCLEKGMHRKAREYLFQGLKLYPENRSLRHELMKIRFDARDFSKVLKSMKDSVEPSELALFASNAAQVLVVTRKFLGLSEFINTCVEELPTNAEKSTFLYLVSTALAKIGSLDEAANQLRRCLDLNPTHPDAGQLLSRIDTKFAV